MTDETLTHTLHNADGTKEVKITTMKDLYIFMNDSMDLKLCKLEIKFNRELRFYNKLHSGAIAVLFMTCICLQVVMLVNFLK